MIDIGDAIMTFRADDTQLEGTFQKWGTEVPAKIAPAQAAIDQTSSTVTDMTGRMAVGAQGATQLGEVTNLAGEKMRASMYEARGELALLGEEFGVHLPRHVRSFIAELPGVGSALSAAFAATAIVFIIQAIAELVGKIQEWKNSQEEINKAMDALHQAQEKTFHDLEDNLIRAQLKTAELTGDHLEALRLKLQLIDNTTLGKLRSELEKLGQEADKDFEKFNRSWFSQTFLGLEGGAGATEKLNDVGKAVDKALSTRTPESFANALKLVDTAIGETDKKLGELQKQAAEVENVRKTALSGRAVSDISATVPPVDPKTIQSYQELSQQLKEYKKDIDEAKKAEEQDAAQAKLQDTLKQLEEQKTVAKDVLDTRLLAIERTKEAERSAFLDSKASADDWAKAQVKAATDAADAHVRYKQQLASIAAQELEASKAIDSGASSLKAKSAAIDAANERTKQQNDLLKAANTGLEKAQQETAKLRTELEKLVFPADKTKEQTQAFKELENAEKQLAQAQENLAQAQISKDTRDQEETIKKLANLRIISKRDEERTLETIQKQEAQVALKELQTQLTQEEAALKAAKAKFQQAEKDLLPDDQVAKFKIELDKAQAAVDKTQASILKLKTGTSDYAAAVALSVAAGNRELTQKILLNHQDLVHNQNLLAEIKSIPVKTKAIQDQIKVLEKLISDEQREEKQFKDMAQSDLTAWKQFSQGFRDQNKQNEQSIEQMGEQTRQAFDQFFADLGDGFAKAIRGEESFGQAFKEAMGKLVGDLCKMWGEYFIKMGVGMILFNPAEGAALIAAGIGLETLGALAEGGGSPSGGSSSSGSSGSTAATKSNNASTVTTANPVQAVNVVHLAEGGIVSQPTFAVVGDSGPEAVLPLRDTALLQRTLGAAIAAAIGPHMRSGGGGDIRLHYSADVPGLVRIIDHNVRSGRVRLHSSTTDRAIKKT